MWRGPPERPCKPRTATRPPPRRRGQHRPAHVHQYLKTGSFVQIICTFTESHAGCNAPVPSTNPAPMRIKMHALSCIVIPAHYTPSLLTQACLLNSSAVGPCLSHIP